VTNSSHVIGHFLRTLRYVHYVCCVACIRLETTLDSKYSNIDEYVTCRWYHGALGRLEAEDLLIQQPEGSFLVRQSESNRLDYSLSLKWVSAVCLKFHACGSLSAVCLKFNACGSLSVGLVWGGDSPPLSSWLCMLTPACWLPSTGSGPPLMLDYEYGYLFFFTLCSWPLKCRDNRWTASLCTWPPGCSPLALSPSREMVVPERRSAWLVVGAQVKACSRETHSPSRASKTYRYNAFQIVHIHTTVINSGHACTTQHRTHCRAGCGYNPGWCRSHPPVSEMT